MKTHKKSIISIVVAAAICLTCQLTAFAATKAFDTNFVNGNNYTLCYNTKATNDEWVTFAVDSGKSLELWASHYSSGIVLTQTIVVKPGQSGQRAFYKTAHSASKGDKLKAGGQLVSKSGTYSVQGRVDFK